MTLAVKWDVKHENNQSSNKLFVWLCSIFSHVLTMPPFPPVAWGEMSSYSTHSVTHISVTVDLTMKAHSAVIVHNGHNEGSQSTVMVHNGHKEDSQSIVMVHNGHTEDSQSMP